MLGNAHEMGAGSRERMLGDSPGPSEPAESEPWPVTAQPHLVNEALPSQATGPKQAVPDRIAIEVGERTFVTSRDTLRGSAYFATLLSGRWDSNAKDSGMFFVDADPDLFVHILRYLRRGIMPLFWDAVKGHDYALYHAVLQEARYFLIPELCSWLEGEKYLQAITTTIRLTTKDDFSDMTTDSAQVDVRLRMETKDVYVCPRHIHIHNGDPDRCGQACHKKIPTYPNIVSQYVATSSLKFDVVERTFQFGIEGQSVDDVGTLIDVGMDEATVEGQSVDNVGTLIPVGMDEATTP